MRIANTEVYEFEELSEEVQDKVIERHRYMEVEYDDWYGCNLEYWRDKLNEIGFEDAKIYFSGFASQGDGAVFEADIDLDKVCSHLLYCDATTYKEARDLRAVALYSHYGLMRGCPDVVRCGASNFYSHENTATVSWLPDYNFVEDVMELIEDLRRALCQEIYTSLEREYEYLTSDEYVKERLIEGDYEFTREGEDWA